MDSERGETVGVCTEIEKNSQGKSARARKGKIELATEVSKVWRKIIFEMSNKI